MIKAIIYDVDGTMVDSEPIHDLAWSRALQQYHHQFEDLSPEFRSSMSGRKPIIISQQMVDELKLPVSPEIFLQKKTEIFMQAIKTELKGMPSVIESVQHLHENGYKLGIGSALGREYITIVLRNLNLDNYFDAIVTGDEIKNGKPHPETYLTVAKKLGFKPKECVVLEDAQSGILAAKAAGCFCVAVANPNDTKQNTSHADKVISSLDKITDVLIKQLSEN